MHTQIKMCVNIFQKNQIKEELKKYIDEKLFRNRKLSRCASLLYLSL